MRKAILLILVFVILLPTQVLASKAMTTSEIEKNYFENYNSRVNEIKAAQKKLTIVLGREVSELTEELKQSTNKYNNYIKNKASKTVISQAKAQLDKDKKALTAAKSELTKEVNKRIKQSNLGLKYINKQKESLTKYIKEYSSGKSTHSDQQFKDKVLRSLRSIDKSFDEILDSLTKP